MVFCVCGWLLWFMLLWLLGLFVVVVVAVAVFVGFEM